MLALALAASLDTRFPFFGGLKVKELAGSLDVLSLLGNNVLLGGLQSSKGG